MGVIWDGNRDVCDGIRVLEGSRVVEKGKRWQTGRRLRVEQTLGRTA